jgi:predicted AAA+ superfamily ATPase
MDIHFWRSTSGAEVDFVVDTGSAVVGLEVKAGASGRPSIPRSARSFIDAYQPMRFLMIGTSRFDPEQIGATEVVWITPDEVASTMRELVG